MSMPEIGPEARATAQLLHRLPDGTSHIDWLMARDAAAERPLITFRLPASLLELSPGEPMTAVRIADHRPRYLRYEGPVSGNRGHVTRVSRGSIRHFDRAEQTWSIQIEWENAGDADGHRTYDLFRISSDTWRVTLRRRSGTIEQTCIQRTSMRT